MKSTIQFRVRYQETDQMGIVHHSVYYIWFEMGRTEWMRERGMSYRDCEEKGWLLPLIESGCQYLHSAAYDDLIELETVMTPEQGVSFRFEYTARKFPEGTVLAKGFTRHVCTNRGHKIDKTATKQLKILFQDLIGL
jgi:acyl-CoA thioester hydrolase